jgi:cellulose synthase operon protein C
MGSAATVRDAGLVFVADDLAAWLVGILADAARKRLTSWVLGTEQERALRRAATAAVQLTAVELRPDGGEQAEELAMVVSEVFSQPLPGLSLSGQATLMEALQAGIARQLAPLGDLSLSGTGTSAAEALGVPVAVLAEKLTSNLIREIMSRGLSDEPLAPLAAQLNHDVTHLQLQQLGGTVGQLAAELRTGPAQSDLAALMRAQARATDELPYRLFGARRPPLSSVYVRQSLSGGVVSPGSALTSPVCSVEDALARHRHLIVIGAPGQGKSTLTFQLVHRLARDWLAARNSCADGRDPVELTPLWVTGRELAAAIHHPWLVALSTAARNELGSHLDLEADFPSGLLQNPVDGAPWLIAIDGLDEAVEPERRDRLVTVLSARLAQGTLPHRLLITSRPLHPAEMARLGQDVGADEVGVYELEPFNATTLQDLARRWLSDGTQSTGAELATRFLHETQVSQLAGVLETPLLALMAITLFEEDADDNLPQFKYDLYERYLGYVLTTGMRRPDWRAVTGDLAGIAGETGHDLQRLRSVRALLEHLAVTQVSSDAPLVTAAYEWLTGAAGPDLRYAPESQAIVENMMTRTGLLVRRGRRWEFIHYSFAEHLAAAAEAAALPDHFDADDPVVRECFSRTQDPFDEIGLITLIHWARQSPTIAPTLLTWLQREGRWHHQELAARLLISGVAGQAQNLDAAGQAVERRALLLDDGELTWLLAALARQWPPAVDALDRISANSIVPVWARASALAAVIQIRGLDADASASALRTLLDERQAGAGWSQVIAAGRLLDLGAEFRTEAIQILRAVLTDPYAHPNAIEGAADVLSGIEPELRAEALAALRAMTADPLSLINERRFAAAGLARLGFPGEAAGVLYAILVDPRTSTLEKAWTARNLRQIPMRHRNEIIAALRMIADDSGAGLDDRLTASWALALISPEDRPTTIGLLRQAVADPLLSPELRTQMAESMASFASAHLTEAVEALEDIFRDHCIVSWLRIYAARAIVRLDFEKYQEVIDMLTDLANSGDPDLRFSAARCLATFDPALYPAAIDTFRDLIADPAIPLSTRCYAAEAWGRLAPDRRDEAVRVLCEVSADPRATASDLFKAAQNLLAVTRSADAKAAAWLKAALDDVTADLWTRARAADQLLQLPTADAPAAIAVLRMILNDTHAEQDLRIWAAQRLAKCGPQYREESLAAMAQGGTPRQP